MQGMFHSSSCHFECVCMHNTPFHWATDLVQAYMHGGGSLWMPKYVGRLNNSWQRKFKLTFNTRVLF